MQSSPSCSWTLSTARFLTWSQIFPTRQPRVGVSARAFDVANSDAAARRPKAQGPQNSLERDHVDGETDARREQRQADDAG